MLPLPPSTVKTRPEPVSKVKLVAADALGIAPVTLAATNAVTAATIPPSRREDRGSRREPDVERERSGTGVSAGMAYLTGHSR
jgi:hypothetical protein